MEPNNKEDITTPEKNKKEQEEKSTVQQDASGEAQEDQDRDSGEVKTLGEFLKESEREEKLQQ